MKNKESSITLEPGVIVRSKTGRDRKRVYLVIGIDPENTVAPVIIANGELRKIEDGKHKNPAHLAYVGCIDESAKKELSQCFTNGKIAEICQTYDIRNNFS